MELSVLITSLPQDAETALAVLAQVPFQHVDLIGKADRGEAERQALADTGLIVDCVALGRDLPAPSSLDALEVSQRQRAVAVVERQIVEAALVGARHAYLVPCASPSALPAFADACRVLAPYARRRMIQLCIEHFPGSALGTAAATLDWLDASALDDMKLLIDLGHCLISKEDPGQVVTRAGERLGYVQLDDNDGSGDLHWPLLSGVLTRPVLGGFLRSLQEAHFRAGVALELNARLEDPLGNLVRSKKIVEELWPAK